MDIFETTYDYFLTTVFGVVNPVKKSIIKTQCKVHKFINIKSLQILKNDNYSEEYNFFSSYILEINEGAVWADQDFKSTNHFYNPYKKKGLYGRRSAMELGVDYYLQALKQWRVGEFKKAMFYLGAALHITHDMTIPQHANIRLLDSHRQYETFVKRTYQHINDFHVESGAYLLETIDEYIRFNARMAIKIYNKFKKIKNEEDRFYKVTKCALPLAKKTTAGAMLMFHRDVFENDKK